MSAKCAPLDNHEADLFALEHELDGDPRAHLFFADVRNEEKMQRMFDGMDYGFHTAALKHVPFCEKSPMEATQTNIMGLQNVIRASVEGGLKRLIFTSLGQGGKSDQCDGNLEAYGRTSNDGRQCPR